MYIGALICLLSSLGLSVSVYEVVGEKLQCTGAGEALGLRPSRLFSGKLGAPLQGADHRYALAGTMPRSTTTEFLSFGRSLNS